jgi:hypothetical protein
LGFERFRPGFVRVYGIAAGTELLVEQLTSGYDLWCGVQNFFHVDITDAQ